VTETDASRVACLRGGGGRVGCQTNALTIAGGCRNASARLMTEEGATISLGCRNASARFVTTVAPASHSSGDSPDAKKFWQSSVTDSKYTWHDVLLDAAHSVTDYAS